LELYAIKYGEAPFPLRYIYRDCTDSKEEIPTEWLFYLAFIGDKTVLIDTGFRNAEQAKKWGLTFTDYPPDLKALLHGRQMDTVVITHSHFDHIDNLDLYPDADVIIARDALQQAEVESPEAICERLGKGKITAVDDEYDINSVFRFMVIGGHDSGSSVLYFSSGDKDYVLTGDECYACGNVFENRPIGSVFADVEKNAAFTLDAHKRGLMPLPCHDKTVFATYPGFSENIARIV
jgi:glyoxylase-like metal-dependent hydrolase (beta-lactamase superfamily II)